jgi:hypothetical protein
MAHRRRIFGRGNRHAAAERRCSQRGRGYRPAAGGAHLSARQHEYADYAGAGTLEYITDALHTLTSNVTIDGVDAMQYYLTGYDPAGDVYSFLLPNGTVLYTDSLGNVLRITENDVDFAIGDFAFTTDDTGTVTSIRFRKAWPSILRAGTDGFRRREL